MSGSFRTLLPLFERERAAGRPLVLAIVIRTTGPTYTKAGELLLMASSGEYAGLLSGGCLEGDLAEHGRQVLIDGQPKVIRYDMQGPDELIFGLGSGCGGAMDILLRRLDAQSSWEPMVRLAEAWRSHREEEWWLVVRSANAELPLGGGIFSQDGYHLAGSPAACGATALIDDAEVLRMTLTTPPHVLLLGAGPDALPVAHMADFLGWRLTVIDHRPRYASTSRFPRADLVLEGGPASLSELLLAGPQRVPCIAAAIVMSHHFLSDQLYLTTLATSEVPYVGLLGPANRRERLMALLGPLAERLRGRLHSPIGLDIGADSAETIALSIAAEIQAHLGRVGLRRGCQANQTSHTELTPLT